MNIQAIRRDFPILERKINGKPLIYFDNAATTQKPRQVIDVIDDNYQNHNANVHRGVHTLSMEATEMYEQARGSVTKFINAKSEKEIVFVRGTTEAINLVAHSLGCSSLGEGDEVLVSLMEHHSNIVPWEILAQCKGFKIRYANVHDDGTLDYEDFETQINKNTRICCLSQVSNVTGVINDVKRITKAAHDNGSLMLVDGAQSIPHMPVDVQEIGMDFLAFSGHKMLAPTGIGVLYGRAEILKQMIPFQGGGEMIKEVSIQEGHCAISWNDLPWKFEAGTPNIEGAVGLGMAVKYLQELGMQNVFSHEKDLTEYAYSRLRSLNNVHLYGSTDVSKKCGIIPFGIEGFSSHEAVALFDEFGVALRSGYHCAQPLHEIFKLDSTARASFYLYNTEEEIDRFIDVIGEIDKV